MLENIVDAFWNGTILFLEPYTQYKVWVKAYTGKNEGLASNNLEIITDVQSKYYIENILFLIFQFELT